MVAAVTVLLLVPIGITPVAGQPQWSSRDLENGGMEFRLRNDDGASIILVCAPQGAVGGFEFPEPVEAANHVSVRGIPGERQNVRVSLLGDRIMQLVGGRGFDWTLSMLSRTATLFVRGGGGRATFDVFGSAATVNECLGNVEAAAGGTLLTHPGGTGVGGVIGTNPSSPASPFDTVPE
ncbi:MAG: hypothetical protein CL484_06755 [Acidobacteria bacterium]|nr:hypothetical protein [Acidobacteriota bacterium]